ncbi:hypothetical protein GCM10009630_51960 [Kribbella jejuensis]|uniref:Uncharacterized protein n=1 Tax=Kribbella jejuensis TaxID=236068 RepID=A0A542ETK1_9ACTN|nr:hypothetical protein [Kribbella jejuensis]TQJ18504.1 hypothetical protein FB475_2649 [Kribbella jejuensis]
MAREPRAVRKAQEELGRAYQRQEDTADNYAEMRRALRGTAQAHMAVRTENKANKDAAKNVKKAEKALERAAEKAAKKSRGR